MKAKEEALKVLPVAVRFVGSFWISIIFARLSYLQSQLPTVALQPGVFGDCCEGLPGVYSTIWCLCYKTN
jgi:hypothetical protein